MNHDILTREDIRLLVDSFYSQVREDSLLKDIFEHAIGEEWPRHLDKMYRFWETVLLDLHTYSGAPFIPHARLPIDTEHFQRWLTLFYATVDRHFSGDKATEAKWRAGKMAEIFLAKITYYRDHPAHPLK